MLDTLMTMCRLFGTHYADIIPMVVIMVSAIIVLIGFAKPFVFDRIKNEDLRRSVLGAMSVVMSFFFAFIYFLAKGWNFRYYVLASIALSACCILTYWGYETIPGVRKFVGGIGNAAIRKIFNVSLLAATNENANAVKTEIKNGIEEVKTITKKELKTVESKVKVDKDLIGL